MEKVKVGTKVDVVIDIYQGIVNSVSVFVSDKDKTAEQKALAYLSEETETPLNSVEDFVKWREQNEGSDYEYAGEEGDVE